MSLLAAITTHIGNPTSVYVDTSMRYDGSKCYMALHWTTDEGDRARDLLMTGDQALAIAAAIIEAVRLSPTERLD